MPAPTSVVLTGANQVFTSATPAPVVGLFFNVASGVRYRFEFWIAASSNSGTNGPGFGMTFPGSTVGCVHGELPLGSISNAARADGLATGTIVTSGAALISAGVITGSDRHLTRLMGNFTPTAAGVLQVTCRTEIQLVGNAITVFSGSNGLLWIL